MQGGGDLRAMQGGGELNRMQGGGDHPVGMQSGESFAGYGAGAAVDPTLAAAGLMLGVRGAVAANGTPNYAGAAAAYGSVPYPQSGESASGQAATAANLFLWGAAAPASMRLTALELQALATAGGWLQTTAINDDGTPAQLNIIDRRAAKWPNGRWTNRNHPNVDLGVGVSTGHDPGHGTWLSDTTSAISTVASDIGDVASALGSDGVAFAKMAVQIAGNDLDAILQVMEWILDFMGDLVALIDPTGTSASRQAALDRMNPTNPNGAIYALLTQDKYKKGLELLILLPILPAVILFDAVDRPLLSHISPQFADLFSPAHMTDTFINVLGAIVEGAATGQNLFQLVQGIVEQILNSVGVQVSPACVVKIAYMCITGPFFPPMPAIALAIAHDPVFQKSADNLLGTGSTIEKILPVAISCFDASDPSTWLTCFEGLLNLVFPGIIQGLASVGVDATSLRVLVQAIWESGGDFEVVLNEVQFPGITEAVMGLGFFGVGWVANAVNSVTHAFNGFAGYGSVDFRAAEDFFGRVVVPWLPADLAQEVTSAFDVFNFALAFLAEGGTDVSINLSAIPAGWPLYLLKQFNAAKWDTEVAVGSIIADQFDPSPGVPKMFSVHVTKQLGHAVFTPALSALFDKIKTDFPRLAYQLTALENLLGLQQPVAITAPAQKMTIGSTIGAQHATVGGGGPRIIAQPSSGQPQSIAPVNSSSKPTSWGAVVASALAGGAVAGGPGAVAGAIAGWALPKLKPSST